MADVSWPAASYNSGAVTDAEYQRIPWGADGLIGSPSEAQDPVYGNSSGLEVHVRAGRYGSVLGRAWSSGATDLNLPIAANSSGSTRIDTVVLRLDRATWQVRAVVRAGTPGGGAPTLVRQDADTGLWEVPLADVTVASGAVSIGPTAVRMRALYRAGVVRPAKALADVTPFAAVGDVLYVGGVWYGWTGSTAVSLLPSDSGDVALSPASGLLASESNSNWARRIDRQVQIDLNLKTPNNVAYSESGIDQNGLTLTTVPSQFRPSRTHYFGVTLPKNTYCRGQVDPAGVVQLWHINDDLPASSVMRMTLTYLI